MAVNQMYSLPSRKAMTSGALSEVPDRSVFIEYLVKRLKQKTDYSEYGGAPILGFEKLVIKAHGRSNAKAITNAIKVASRSIEKDVTQHISESIVKFNHEHQMDFMEI